MLPHAVFSVERSVNIESAGFVPRLRKSSQTDWKGDVRISYFETELGCALQI